MLERLGTAAWNSASTGREENQFPVASGIAVSPHLPAEAFNNEMAGHWESPTLEEHPPSQRLAEGLVGTRRHHAAILSSFSADEQQTRMHASEFAPNARKGFRQRCQSRSEISHFGRCLGMFLLASMLLDPRPAYADRQPAYGAMHESLPRWPRRSAGHQGEGYLSNMGTLPSKHLDALRRASEDGNICGRDPLQTTPRTGHDLSSGDIKSFSMRRDDQPPLALFLDFDKTISQHHLYHLARRSSNGLAGVMRKKMRAVATNLQI
jgi:hypothetical protein